MHACRFNFMRQGQVLVMGADEDELFEAAIEAGADDVQPVFDEEGQPTSDFKVGLQRVGVFRAQAVLRAQVQHMQRCCASVTIGSMSEPGFAGLWGTYCMAAAQTAC
jgi:transcriptional/translational regulatory protein YebC/TACO1